MDEQLRALLAAWLADDIDGAKLAPILERLKEDAQFRADFVAEIILLGQLKAVQSSEPRWLELDAAMNADSATLDFEDRIMQNLPSRKQPAWQRLLLPLAAVALFCGALWMLRTPEPPAEIANPTRPPTTAIDELLAESAAAAVAVLSVLGTAEIAEGELAPGPLRLDSGLVQIDFFSGVRMLLRGPAEIEIRSAIEVYMTSGEASCYVSELGRGFRILTADGEVIDLGTAFGIRVRPQQAAEVHVFEGEVSVRPRNASAATDFHAKEAVSLGVDRLSPTEFTREGFPNATEFTDRLQARYDAWLAHGESLSADPDVLLHCSFEGQQATDSVLHNQATTEARSSQGAIIGTKWDRGRWPMKSALHFRGPSDRVLFKIPGSYRQLTMLVWLRIDALPDEHQVLLLSEPAERWSIHGHLSDAEQAAANSRRVDGDAFAMRWTLRKTGDGNLNFLQGARNNVTGLGHGLSPRISPAQLGQWHCLATVYDADADTIAYYIDGAAPDTQEAKYRGPIHLDFMELGNLSLTSADASRKYRYRFYGSFDEVLIAKRAMSVDEIQAIYEIGRPE